jgi:hypothetical protein
VPKVTKLLPCRRLPSEIIDFSRLESAAELLSILKPGVTRLIETPKTTNDTRREATDLYWLAFLLAERQDLSIDIAADTAVSWDNASPGLAATARYQKI